MNSHRFFEIRFDTGDLGTRAVFIFHPLTEADFGLELRQQIEELLENKIREFEVDLRAVNVCNSITLGAFVGLQNRVQKCDGRITFVLRRDTHIRKMFTTLMLDRLLTVREVQTSHREHVPSPAPASAPVAAPPPSPAPRSGQNIVRGQTPKGRELEVRTPIDPSYLSPFQEEEEGGKF